MQRLLIIAVTCLAWALAGCATGPKFHEVESNIGAMPQGKARIYFYRTTAMGAAVQPSVKLNGTVVGAAEPKGVFFVDRDPGDMEVSTSTEVERKLTFTVAAGETRYVRLGMHMGFFVGHVIPELVDEKEAKEDIAGLAFTGSGGASK
jgi:Protein of unknown function (DUF2846)